MSRPNFVNGVLLALVLAPAGAASFAALALISAPGPALRIVIAALGALYVAYLLRAAQARVGRPSVAALWLAAAAALWFAAPPLGLYLVAHVALVWGVRVLYHHAGVLAALLDAAVSALALAAAVWAALGTHSVLLAVWCFFLVQALFTAIPGSPAHPQTGGEPQARLRFRRAQRTAEAALARLHAHPDRY